MSEEIRTMKKEIRTATAFAIGVYAVVLSYLFFPGSFLSIGSLLDSPLELSTSGPILVPIVLALAGYLVIGGLHNVIDSRFFKQRARVDSFIATELTKPCRDLHCPRALKDGILREETSMLVNDLFMATLIPADDTERERSFSYFTEYFVSVNLSAISIAGALAALTVPIFSPLSAIGPMIVYFVVVLLLPLALNGLRVRVSSRLIRPAQAQTRRILNMQLTVLKGALPGFRLYNVGLACRDSGKCPLLPPP